MTYSLNIKGPVPTKLSQSEAPAATTSGAYIPVVHPPVRCRNSIIDGTNVLVSTTTVSSSAYMASIQPPASTFGHPAICGPSMARFRLQATSSAVSSLGSITCSLPYAAQIIPGRMWKISLSRSGVISQLSATQPLLYSTGHQSAPNECSPVPLSPYFSKSPLIRCSITGPVYIIAGQPSTAWSAFVGSPPHK
ncbi:hypothetical protein ES707_18483 [subsurface metagenome]